MEVYDCKEVLSNVTDLKASIEEIKHLRGAKREHAINAVCTALCEYYNGADIETVKLRRAFFSVGMKERTRERLFNAVLACLVARGCTKYTLTRTIYTFENAPLSSFDGDSWSVLKKKRACVSVSQLSVIRRSFPVKTTFIKMQAQ